MCRVAPTPGVRSDVLQLQHRPPYQRRHLPTQGRNLNQVNHHQTPELPTAGFVYYGEPIDLANGPGPAGYRITRALSGLGLTCFRPATTWTGGNWNPLFVEKINRQALYHADVVIADFSTGLPSTGLPMEIEAATARGIPAVVLRDPLRPRSVSLQANSLVHWCDGWEETAAAADKLARQHFAERGQVDALRLLVADGAKPPAMVYADDAGLDLETAETTVIQPGEFADISTTVVGVQPPADTWLMITGRSSTLRKKKLHVPVAVIDPGWRGPLFVGAWNLGQEPVTVHAGERIGQVIAIHNRTADLQIQVVDGVAPHARGLAGFGSSGS